MKLSLRIKEYKENDPSLWKVEDHRGVVYYQSYNEQDVIAKKKEYEDNFNTFMNTRQYL